MLITVIVLKNFSFHIKLDLEILFSRKKLLNHISCEKKLRGLGATIYGIGNY